MHNIKNLRRLGIVFTILCLAFSVFFISSNVSADINISDPGSEIYIEPTEYNFTTKYIDSDGNKIESDSTGSTTLAGSTYYPTVKSIAGETLSDGTYKGYKYVGYYYVDEVGTYSSGSLSNLLTNDPPYVTTETQGKDSASGVGSYTIYIVYVVYYDNNPGSSSGSSGTSSGSSSGSSATSSGSSTGSSSGTESSGTSTEISSSSGSGSSSGGQAATTSGTSTSGTSTKQSSNPSTGDMYPLIVLMIFIIPFALLSFSSLLYNHQQSRNIKF